MGIRIGEEGFYYCYSPFRGDKELNKRTKPFLPPSFNLDLFDMELKKAVKEFSPPEPTAKGNFEVLKEEWALIKDKVFTIPSGYFGICERANEMLGFRENLMYRILNPKIVEEIYEKITKYKVGVSS